MKLVVKSEGGPSPGLTIIGEQADLLSLADQLKVGASEKEEGAIRVSNALVHGDRCEWIEFQVVKNF